MNNIVERTAVAKCDLTPRGRSQGKQRENPQARHSHPGAHQPPTGPAGRHSGPRPTDHHGLPPPLGEGGSPLPPGT